MDALLWDQIKRVLGNSLIKLVPVVGTHPLGHPEGEFTDIELRAARVRLGVGAKTVFVWIGPLLTDHDVITRQPLGAAGEWY